MELLVLDQQSVTNLPPNDQEDHLLVLNILQNTEVADP
jgi:hypothetical protein